VSPAHGPSRAPFAEAVTSFRFAKDPSECQVQQESVPEPGTVLLVGSGLMGLGGYSGLRPRTRD